MSINYGFGNYLKRNAIALDQLLNTILSGYPEETLSSRTYRSAHLADDIKKRWVVTEKIINTIFFWQDEHCKASYEAEINGSYKGRLNKEKFNMK